VIEGDIKEEQRAQGVHSIWKAGNMVTRKAELGNGRQMQQTLREMPAMLSLEFATLYIFAHVSRFRSAEIPQGKKNGCSMQVCLDGPSALVLHIWLA
jgi:hypothetical protein